MLRAKRSLRAFALYEVLLGVTVFVLGVLALGRSVQNCLNASSLSAEDARVRLLLSNRMAEIQVTPTVPDPSKESKINTGYGVVRLIQKTVPVNMVEDDGSDLTGIRIVTLTAEWLSGGTKQRKQLEFYVYRAG